MKLTYFGLWFWEYSGRDRKWSATVPREPGFLIYYDGRILGEQWADFDLTIYDDEPHIIRLKRDYAPKEPSSQVLVYGFAQFRIGRLLTLEDFDIELRP